MPFEICGCIEKETAKELKTEKKKTFWKTFCE